MSNRVIVHPPDPESILLVGSVSALNTLVVGIASQIASTAAGAPQAGPFAGAAVALITNPLVFSAWDVGKQVGEQIRLLPGPGPSGRSSIPTMAI